MIPNSVGGNRRVEQLREWYEADPEGETVELPAVDAAIPDCPCSMLRLVNHSHPIIDSI
jgi:hypothetical protein